MVRTLYENIIHTHEIGFIALYNTGIWRYGNLAISKGIECINSHIRRYPGCQVDNDLYIFRRIIFDLLDLDLALIIGRDHTIDQSSGSSGIRYFCNGQGPFIALNDLGSHPDPASAHPFIVITEIGHTTHLEIREEIRAITF